MTEPPNESSAWRSLERIGDVARSLLGTDAGREALDRWLTLQIERTRDPAFARLFSNAPRPPGVRADDYLHRVVEGDGLRMLGGIRLFGEDSTRPFVEVIAWTPLDEGQADEDPWHTPVLERVRGIVADEWRAFSPLDARLLWPLAGGTPPVPLHDQRADQHVHVADVRTMAGADADRDGDRDDAAEGRVTLAPFTDIDAALVLVEKRYATLEREHPALARDVTPADRETLAECRAADSLHAIRAHGRTVGLIATLPGRIGWLDCHVVMEEAVPLEHAGRGYAAAAQHALAARLARIPGSRLLGGTIDARNVASSRTAERAGRRVAFRHDFLPLRRASGAP